MDIERAMEILDPEHREKYDSIETVNEACRMGIEALRKLREAQEGDYIGREEIIKRIRSTKWPDYIKDVLIEEVTLIPAANVRPVVRGKWVLDSDPGEPWKYRCDQCGETTTDTCMGKPRANWCPLCGAYMREDGAGDKKQVEAAAPAEPEWIKGRLIDNLREWMCPKCGWNTFLPLGKPSYCEDCGWKPKQGDQ